MKDILIDYLNGDISEAEYRQYIDIAKTQLDS